MQLFILVFVAFFSLQLLIWNMHITELDNSNI